ncbi:LPS export ABC transporter periplasmic protein LptC [Sneathiella glossodoripedis]|uniref:LPS export ABC transporter periplasmic protein LptC n=1 Tax=Sneathiella glossodoripedis TaxID=418853 RepID=UPI000A0111CC|nr:LPS export ABC transporter periplasmic protein LptC [Sneathiella glossodoripedis]
MQKPRDNSATKGSTPSEQDKAFHINSQMDAFRKHALHSGRHTRFVSVMKWMLPTLALLLLGVAFIMPGLKDQNDEITLEYSSINQQDSKLTMTNPRFLSSDQGNQQYMVTADSASQVDADSNRIELVNLQADITLSTGQWFSVSAPKGWLDQSQETLDLVGGVEIFSDDGNQIYAKTARILLNEKRVLSPDGLQGHGPLGELSSDSFVANQLTGTLKFEGNVKMTLYP